jgi:hypothetical protein
MRIEKLVAEAGNNLGTQGKGMPTIGSHYQAVASEN